jgi:hypothetical protein
LLSVLTSKDTSSRSRRAVLPEVSHCLFVLSVLINQEYSQNIKKFYLYVISLRMVTVIFIVTSFYIKVLQTTFFSASKTWLPKIVKYFASRWRPTALRKM